MIDGPPVEKDPSVYDTVPYVSHMEGAHVPLDQAELDRQAEDSVDIINDFVKKLQKDFVKLGVDPGEHISQTPFFYYDNSGFRFLISTYADGWNIKRAELPPDLANHIGVVKVTTETRDQVPFFPERIDVRPRTARGLNGEKLVYRDGLLDPEGDERPGKSEIRYSHLVEPKDPKSGWRDTLNSRAASEKLDKFLVGITQNPSK